jgi:hypothetical protein
MSKNHRYLSILANFLLTYGRIQWVRFWAENEGLRKKVLENSSCGAKKTLTAVRNDRNIEEFYLRLLAAG